MRQDHTVESHSRKDIDLTNIDEVESILQNRDYQAVLYTAGLTDPEACETEKEKAYFLNADVPGKMARILAKKNPNAVLIYFSDSMIFDGEKEEPYVESDTPNPLSVYAKSKWQAEKEISEASDNYLIIRCSWLFGKKMKGIFKKLVQIYEEQGELKVAGNYFGNPTYTRDVGHSLNQLIEKKFRGVVHLAAENRCSWYDYTAEVVRYFKPTDDLVKTVHAIESDASHLKSVRPKNSSLASEKISNLGIRIPDWRDGLNRFLSENFKERQA